MDSAAPRQRALVTGASNGIGLELVRVLAREGWDLVVTARNQVELDRLASELSSSYRASVRAVAADLASPDGVCLLMNHMTSAGLTVDALVNNAGFGLSSAPSPRRPLIASGR